ncbi:MAG: hypothetical protein GYB66_07800 [Chloroflexi bacterium]|nr:hypothetical protein [Chloroflexota bacterium]
MNKRRRRAILILCLGLGLALAGALAMPVSLPTVQAQDGGDGSDEDPEPEPVGDNSYCLVCHDNIDEDLSLPDGTVLDLQISDETQKNFIHASHDLEIGVGCVDCHGNNFPHQNLAIETYEEYVHGYVGTCLNCHEGEVEQFNVELQFEDFGESEALEGTVCLECHGPEVEAIEGDPAALTVDVTLCADCHQTTVDEWRRSAHGEQQLGCNTCHLPHQGELRFETADALCLNCHDQDRDDFVHISHVDESCDSCHWHRSTDRAMHILTSDLQASGHDGQVETSACVDCHSTQDIVLATDETGGRDLDEHPFIQSRERIETLEAEIEEQREEAANTAEVRLVQSIVFGLALGVIIGVVFLLYRRWRQPEYPVEE